jgi:putative DNA primase/helicase
MSDLVLPADIADKFWSYGSMLRVAARSEKLAAFELCARNMLAFENEDLPRAEIVDRLQALAMSSGIVGLFGDEAVQERMAAAIESMVVGDDNLGAFEEESRAPEFSDEAIALLFAEQHCRSTRYVAGWGKWLLWTGTQWRADDTLRAMDYSRRICRSVSHQCKKKNTAKAIAGAKTVAAVLSLARADRRIAANVDQWDADPWLLNTPAGIVDLRSGLRRPHDPDDHLTKITGVAPDASCSIDEWLRFLSRVCDGDERLIAFLKRVLGYALTGLIQEHALFFLYGTGANGKTTFLGCVTGCVGDYHRTAAIETFTASNTEGHPTDIAGLRGARIVTSVETEEGRRWAEAKIKSLTGGDPMAARFMRQDFFEFTPTFKLVIAGNHMPSLRSVDEAIRRRFHLIPFTVTIPLAERDKKLKEKLKAEWPGILAWMIEGCLEWQQTGLDPPDVVKDATASYLEAEDVLGAWIDEAGERDPNAFETSGALFAAWKKYAQRNGEWVGGSKKFSQRLDERGGSIGLRKDRDSQGRRGFYGLRLAILATPDRDDQAGS